MKNFNLPKQNNIPLARQKVFQLYEVFFGQKPLASDFVDICQEITNHLIDLAGDENIDPKTINLIKESIYYIVNNLRDASEYNSDLDQKKKQIVFDLETVAKDFFDTLKNRVDDNVSMEDIDLAWQKECLNKN